MINIKNIDGNECIKWCLVRSLNHADHHPARITKADKDFVKNLDFKDIKFPVKVRDIYKIKKKKKKKKKKKNSIGISVFGYENEKKYPIYVSKRCCKEKHVDLSSIEEKGKRHYVPIKDFNTFMYNHTLHRIKNIFVVIVYKLLVQKKY